MITATSRLAVGSTETPVSDIQIIKQDVGVDADLQSQQRVESQQLKLVGKLELQKHIHQK